MQDEEAVIFSLSCVVQGGGEGGREGRDDEVGRFYINSLSIETMKFEYRQGAH